ncbi:MAG TPA: peptidase E [Granulicella sp.]
MTRLPQIVAMGGGGFSMEPENLRLDRFALACTGSAEPKVCFVPTASGDAQGYIEKFYASFHTLPCLPSHLSLFSLNFADLHSFVLQQDVIYVGGGNTRNLLALWREWGLDQILREAWQSGIVLAGISAGAVCWFEEGVSDSVTLGVLQKLPCLGLLPGSFCPHYDGEANRRPTYHQLLASGEIKHSGYAADDGVALHFVDQGLVEAVSSRPEAKAYAVLRDGASVEEIAIEPRLLP